MRVRGIVQRLIISPETGMFRVEYRCRDLASLLVDTEWGWTARKIDAYVFPEFSRLQVARPDSYEFSAEMHADALKNAGEEHVHAVVWSRDCEAQMERRREAERVGARRHRAFEVASEQVYAATAKRLGEHEGGRGI